MLVTWRRVHVCNKSILDSSYSFFCFSIEMQCTQQCYGLCKLFLCCCLSSAMVAKKPQHQRVPMSAREVINMCAMYNDIARGEGECTTHFFVFGWLSNAQVETVWKPLGNSETRVETNHKTHGNHGNYKKKEDI